MEEQTEIPKPPKVTCVSCGAKLKGDYCRKCGEKKIIPERDFRLSKFLSQSLWHFVRFDSKLLQSAWLLLSQPGLLTSQWITGRRVGYMKPLQLFIIASLLFYFFLPKIPIYYSSPSDLVTGYQENRFNRNAFHFDFRNALSKKALTLGLDEKILSDHIVTIAARQSKTWLFFIIPVWGTWIYLLFQRKIPWLAPHLIFAMHGLIFYMMADLLIHALLNILGITANGFHIYIVLNSLFFFYQIIAIRRVYRSPWPLTIFKTVIIMAGFIVTILTYRQIITIGTLFFLKGIEN